MLLQKISSFSFLLCKDFQFFGNFTLKVINVLLLDVIDKLYMKMGCRIKSEISTTLFDRSDERTELLKTLKVCSLIFKNCWRLTIFPISWEFFQMGFIWR